MTGTPSHHTSRGFRNSWPDTTQVRRRDIFQWMWRRRTSRHPRFSELAGSLPVAEPDIALLHQPPADRLVITWLGHATCLIQFAGLNILTDPVFSQRCSPVRFAGPGRLTAFPVAPADLPAIDVVVISHNHYDHLDSTAAHLLGNSARWLVPLGIKRWLAKQHISNSLELDWWHHVDLADDIKFVCLPARHFSSRYLWDRNRTLWASWLLEVNGKRVYYAGDTGYEQHFKQIGDAFGPPDLALLPIGAYRPEWFMLPMHLNPAQAVQAHLDLGARHSLGIHWGTFILSDESPDEPPRLFIESALQRGLVDDEVFVMQPGETKILE